ncbi:MAG: NAD-glutamate dehydrogenase, partial [Rhizobiales bacterium]|nr:NAD-glutamate dehydrogenase [Hyphomicrobiales bacterium]
MSMAREGLHGTEEERAVRKLVDQAAEILATRGSAVQKVFVAEMFEHTSAEDLAAYAPLDIASLSESAFAFIAARKSGAPKIRFATPNRGDGGEHLDRISTIEIVNDDMPFLVDSVMAEIAARGLHVALVVHPVFAVKRDAAGKLIKLSKRDAADAAGSARESFIHIHVERIDDEVRRTEAVQALEQVLRDVRVCVQDWKAMLARMHELIADLKANPPPLPVDEIAEAVQFLEWLLANNFTFLGMREYRFDAKEESLDPIFETGLGLMRSREMRELRRGAQLVAITPEILEFLKEPKPLIVTKSAVRSRVHRHVYMDFVAVKRFDGDGRLIGDFRIIGLYTSTAYTRQPSSIPYLRRKLAAVFERARFDPDSHSGKALINVLDSYSRDELFQIDEDTLFQFALAIMQLDERPRVRVLPRRDRFNRFVSILVYVPRERFNSQTRASIGEFLAKAYRGHVSAYYPFFPDGPLVRVHFIIGRRDDDTPNPNRAELEHSVETIIRTWTDALLDVLRESNDPARARELFVRYGEAFSAGYQEDYTPAIALGDIGVLEMLSSERPLSVAFYTRTNASRICVGLRVWSYNRPIPLSERVPVLENMSFRVVDERTYAITPRADGGASIWLHDMTLERTDAGAIDLQLAKPSLEAAFLMVMRGLSENDGYNALVLTSGLGWRDVALLRTISRFLRQIRVPFSQDYMWTTLRKHTAIAADFVRLFETRFDPRVAISQSQRGEQEAAIIGGIETALQSVESLDEDRILRYFRNAVQAAVRTNFYQIDRDGLPKALIAIKFDSQKLDNLPLPRPLYEIFVYSPRVEGVHLRFGKVARGGIRWSDRPQDFRTEILGLVKAQQVKNAVIIPVGAKGGFVPKFLPTGGPREAIQAEGIAAYKLFISTLLDITDNLSPEGVIAPDNMVRHDGDDPYLVVAADKGTATFSDTANGISNEHGFWLGDAFASGGSAGYDHKKMGITARGAWEAVKRHFREMDIDVTTTPFTVAGVGDMSGDVFGNGMLRENTIKLVAAFDHRDIFIDPDPDPKRSFAERKRLFDLPRSSWQDYDKALISRGGGVFPRSAKEIALSAEMRTLTGLPAAKATPQDVIRAILKMPVDLVFFGGIGTYIRASSESDDAVGDRTNDAIRVPAGDLQCRLIGEGANLGMTQRGRIEAARKGVRLNTDAIDNSAGVNTSDVEVNIKIALSLQLRSGELSVAARNALLNEMTDDVVLLVLRNNYLQTLALSLSERRGLDDLGFLQRLMQTLEARGELNRAVEFLPDDMELAERRRQGMALTRPELSVLLAYAKLSLFEDLLRSKVPDDPYLARELGRYFPGALSRRFPQSLEQHRLRREIIATQLSNSMINRGGPSLVVRIADQTGAAPDAIAAAFAAARDSYDMPALNDAINTLDAKVPGKLQLGFYAAVQDLLLDRLIWFLRNVDLTQGLAPIVEHYKKGIEMLGATLDGALSEAARAAMLDYRAELEKAGVPEAIARRFAGLAALRAGPDIVLVADRTKIPIADVAATYFAVSDYFKIDRIETTAREIVLSDYFDRLAFDRT